MPQLVELARLAQADAVGVPVAGEQLLAQRRPVVRLVRLGADERHPAGEPGGAQLLAGPQPGQRRADDDHVIHRRSMAAVAARSRRTAPTRAIRDVRTGRRTCSHREPHDLATATIARCAQPARQHLPHRRHASVPRRSRLPPAARHILGASPATPACVGRTVATDCERRRRRRRRSRRPGGRRARRTRRR